MITVTLEQALSCYNFTNLKDWVAHRFLYNQQPLESKLRAIDLYHILLGILAAHDKTLVSSDFHYLKSDIEDELRRLNGSPYTIGHRTYLLRGQGLGLNRYYWMEEITHTKP